MRHLHGPTLLPSSTSLEGPDLLPAPVPIAAGNGGSSSVGPAPTAANSSAGEGQGGVGVNGGKCHPERLGLGDFEAHHCGPVTALTIYEECVLRCLSLFACLCTCEECMRAVCVCMFVCFCDCVYSHACTPPTYPTPSPTHNPQLRGQRRRGRVCKGVVAAGQSLPPDPPGASRLGPHADCGGRGGDFGVAGFDG